MENSKHIEATTFFFLDSCIFKAYNLSFQHSFLINSSNEQYWRQKNFLGGKSYLVTYV